MEGSTSSIFLKVGVYDACTHMGCVRTVGGPYGTLHDKHGTPFGNNHFN